MSFVEYLLACWLGCFLAFVREDVNTEREREGGGRERERERERDCLSFIRNFIYTPQTDSLPQTHPTLFPTPPTPPHIHTHALTRHDNGDDGNDDDDDDVDDNETIYTINDVDDSADEDDDSCR